MLGPFRDASNGGGHQNSESLAVTSHEPEVQTGDQLDGPHPGLADGTLRTPQSLYSETEADNLLCPTHTCIQIAVLLDSCRLSVKPLLDMHMACSSEWVSIIAKQFLFTDNAYQEALQRQSLITERGNLHSLGQQASTSYPHESRHSHDHATRVGVGYDMATAAHDLPLLQPAEPQQGDFSCVLLYA